MWSDLLTLHATMHRNTQRTTASHVESIKSYLHSTVGHNCEAVFFFLPRESQRRVRGARTRCTRRTSWRAAHVGLVSVLLCAKNRSVPRQSRLETSMHNTTLQSRRVERVNCGRLQHMLRMSRDQPERWRSDATTASTSCPRSRAGCDSLTLRGQSRGRLRGGTTTAISPF